MPAYICTVRVHLPRPLFRKLMAQAILERTDLSTLVIRAIRSESPAGSREARRRQKAPEKGASTA
jgi:hypothetical protein